MVSRREAHSLSKLYAFRQGKGARTVSKMPKEKLRGLQGHAKSEGNGKG